MITTIKYIYAISCHIYHPVVYVSVDNNNITSLKSNTALIWGVIQYWLKCIKIELVIINHMKCIMQFHTSFFNWIMRPSEKTELLFSAPTGCGNVLLVWKRPMSHELTKLRIKRLGSIGHISSTNEGLKFTINKLCFIICVSFSVHLLQSYNDIDVLHIQLQLMCLWSISVFLTN